MWMSRLIVLPLLAAAACTPPAPRVAEAPARQEPRVAQAPAEQSPQHLRTAMAEECHKAVTWHGTASIPQAPTAALMRDDWVQVDGVVEWRGEGGAVSRNAWTCDMFRGEDGVWRRRYLSYGPVQG